MTAYLSLGSNLGDREGYLRSAIGLLEESGIRVRRVSSLYETEPVEKTDQPWFLNIVAEVETALPPEELLSACRAIESNLGRQRETPKGPRTLDIDILLYEDVVMETPELRLPHPRMRERRFVLAPLAEIKPDLKLPGSKATVSELLAALPRQEARNLGLLNRDG